MSDLPAIKYLDRAIAELAAESKGDPAYRNWSQASGYLNLAESTRASIIAHARTLEALAKYEPEPVDEDEAALRRIISALHEEHPAGGWLDYFGPELFMAALAQYKAERPTITDDEALLIAREICARVAEGLQRDIVAQGYRAGRFSKDPEFQFALAMVKRDPAALEAFRGVDRG